MRDGKDGGVVVCEGQGRVMGVRILMDETQPTRPAVRGMVLLSGYPSALYDRLFSSWVRVERQAFADGGRPRIEVLWLNKKAHERQLAQQQVMNFSEAVECG